MFTRPQTLLAPRWNEDRLYFTLNRGTREAWLEASWDHQPGHSTLKLYWSRRTSSRPLSGGLNRSE